MAIEADKRGGDSLRIAYTPSAAALAAGQVQVIGVTAASGPQCVVATQDIAQNVAGSVEAGGGVYDVKNINNAAVGAKVWWDDTANGVTTTSTSNALFGYIVELGPRIIPTVAEHLKDPNARVREHIAQALGLIGDRSAIAALESTQRDPDVNVARAAERALARIHIIEASRQTQKAG